MYRIIYTVIKKNLTTIQLPFIVIFLSLLSCSEETFNQYIIEEKDYSEDNFVELYSARKIAEEMIFESHNSSDTDGKPKNKQKEYQNN